MIAWLMRLPVGLKLIAIVVTVLGVGSTLYYTIQSIQKSGKEELILELQEKELDRLEKINEATNPIHPPTVDDSLRYLRDRPGGR